MHHIPHTLRNTVIFLQIAIPVHHLRLHLTRSSSSTSYPIAACIFLFPDAIRLSAVCSVQPTDCACAISPIRATALLSCFTTIYSHKISDCICDTTAYMISHFKKRTVNVTYSPPDSSTYMSGRITQRLPQMQLLQNQYARFVPCHTQFHQGSCLRRYRN